MHFQLREYRIEDGRLEDFVQEWRELVLPLRLSMGFSVFGPWVEEEEGSRFVCVVGYDGDIRAADEAYSSSPERHSMEPDPARLVADIRQVWLEAP